MRRFALLLIVLTMLPILASEPGQPLDCSDWVFDVPGLTCTTVIPDCEQAALETQNWCYKGESVEVLSEYGPIEVGEWTLDIAERVDCGVGDVTLFRVELNALTNGVHQRLGVIQDRCGINGRVDRIRSFPIGQGGGISNSAKVSFDPYKGHLYVTLASACESNSLSGPCEYGDPTSHSIQWVGRIEGFATIFEILQSYEPIFGDVSFHVPVAPEGFSYADSFDTYYGDLSTVGDWSQAQPLQCGYPATPPEPGDYLSVDDPLPDPAPGQGRYYITAVNYQGQRRYGRKSDGGVLSGRDPAVLPICQ